MMTDDEGDWQVIPNRKTIKAMKAKTKPWKRMNAHLSRRASTSSAPAKKPDLLAMYAKNITKWPIDKYGVDELGVIRPKPFGTKWWDDASWWTYDLYFCQSHRHYGNEGLWARSKTEAKKRINETWRVVRIY
jgi:hypothetical protein